MSNGAKLLLPDARFRSPTAVEGKADMRDENIYSAIVVNNGGAGQQKVFTVPQGQAIPRIQGTAITTIAPHQGTYSELTTNLSKAGELGSSIGDASLRAIGITIENGAYDSAGALRSFGAGQQEVSDILSKTFFQLKIAGKLQISGATFMFPATGAAYGGISTTEAAVTVATMNNGWPGSGRRLKLPILVARTDTIEGVFGVASSAALAFSVTADPGQPCLIWFNLHALVINLAKLLKNFFSGLASPLTSFPVASAVAA